MPSESPQALPFVIDAAGCFGPAEVGVRFDPAPRPTTPLLETLIDEEWRRRTDVAARTGQHLFNGRLLRYVGHRVNGARFELIVGRTCYRDFVGTNLFNHHRLAEFGWSSFANPVGTTATLLTADGRIVYGRRSHRVAYHGGYVHTFGGALEAQDESPGGVIDPFASVRRELHEELGLGVADVADLVCVGLIHDTEIHQPELLFEARVRLSERDVAARLVAADAAGEHVGIVSLDDRGDAVLPFLCRERPIAPVAVGALLLYGRRRWGESWFASVAGDYPAAVAR